MLQCSMPPDAVRHDSSLHEPGRCSAPCCCWAAPSPCSAPPPAPRTRPAAPPTSRSTSPPPPPPTRTATSPRTRPWTATRTPAGPAPSATPSGCRSTSAPRPPSARSSSPGRRPTPRRSASRSRRRRGRQLDPDLLHHHGHRRHADAQRQRQRPLPARLRHPAGDRLRLLHQGAGRLRRYAHRAAGLHEPAGVAGRCRPTSSSSTRRCPRPASRARSTRSSPSRRRTSSAPQRYVLAFKPGTYNGINVNMGFYTSVIGLGRNPDDVTINGDVTVDAGWFGGNATQNFWRSIENLSIVPSGQQRRPLGRRAGRADAPGAHPGQAQPGPERLRLGERRLHRRQQDRRQRRAVFTAAVVHPGQLHRQLGQRRVEHGVLRGAGCTGEQLPQPAYTTVGTTPVIREKPYLYLDGSTYRVFVPDHAHERVRHDLVRRRHPGHVHPARTFYVVTPGTGAGTINQALGWASTCSSPRASTTSTRRSTSPTRTPSSSVRGTRR